MKTSSDDVIKINVANLFLFRSVFIVRSPISVNNQYISSRLLIVLLIKIHMLSANEFLCTLGCHCNFRNENTIQDNVLSLLTLLITPAMESSLWFDSDDDDLNVR